MFSEYQLTWCYNAISDYKLQEIIDHIKKKYRSTSLIIDVTSRLESHMTIEKMHYLYKQNTQNPVG